MSRTLTKSKPQEQVLRSEETVKMMKQVDHRFSALEDSLEDFKKEIRDTFLAMEHSMETLRAKMNELQTELVDWQDDVPPGSISKH